ncbi:MAG: tetratricopeptide repeat protein [Bacteroidaceae bacterium]|nr:tetratricopeptide repeat protein [Bacteroidaceae bacterium]
MKNITIYILAALLPCLAIAQDAESGATMQTFTKAMGDSLYMANDYKEAAYVYEQLLSAEGEAAEVYYNLANSYYKDNEIAKAVLNYERALLLAPADEDVKFNLAIARSKTVDKVSEPYEIFFITWIEAVVNLLGMTAWAIIAITAFVILLLSVLLFLFSRNITIRKVTFFLAVFTLLLTVFANLAALHHYHNMENGNGAIIMLPSVTAKSTPDASGTDLFVIHEGRKVYICDDTMKGWKEIELEDGTRGWVPAASIEKI